MMRLLLALCYPAIFSLTKAVTIAPQLSTDFDVHKPTSGINSLPVSYEPNERKKSRDGSTARAMLMPAYVRFQSIKKPADVIRLPEAELSFDNPSTELFPEVIETIPRITATSNNLSTESPVTHTEPGMLEELHPVQHAALPRGLQVHPMPLEGADHELQLNVTWLPTTGPSVSDYSLEVTSVTDTIDCMTPMCYEYNIPGESRWWLVPSYPSPVAESCAVKPGCAYSVRLIAHPWDGHTSANIQIQLNECEAGICSCAHSPRLPTPRVSAHTIPIHGELFVNVTWVLPPPSSPNRLPSGLKKAYYFVSIGKQMVSDAHPSPWFAHAVSRRVEVDSPVASPDGPRWLLLPTAERSGPRGEMRMRSIVLDVKLLARVNLIDERGCIGPAGNATAYDPLEAKKISIVTYAVWAIFGGACVLAIVTVYAVSAPVVKRVLNVFRPATSSAALEPLRARPTWFPLSINSSRDTSRNPSQPHLLVVNPTNQQTTPWLLTNLHWANVVGDGPNIPHYWRRPV